MLFRSNELPKDGLTYGGLALGNSLRDILVTYIAVIVAVPRLIELRLLVELNALLEGEVLSGVSLVELLIGVAASAPPLPLPPRP